MLLEHIQILHPMDKLIAEGRFDMSVVNGHWYRPDFDTSSNSFETTPEYPILY